MRHQGEARGGLARLARGMILPGSLGRLEAAGMRTVCRAITRAASLYLHEDRLQGWTEEAWAAAGPNGALSDLLERWS